MVCRVLKGNSESPAGAPRRTPGASPDFDHNLKRFEQFFGGQPIVSQSLATCEPLASLDRRISNKASRG
jgi:hypothetical protein